MERVEDLGRAGRLTRGGPLVSGERVHRHDLDVVAERFRPRGEPVGERPPAPALDHVQEPGGTPVPPGRRIHGHGHIPAAPGRVPPHVLVHAQHPCPVEPAFVADQVPQPPLDRTASLTMSHEQAGSLAHARTLFDLSTTSATARHAAASVIASASGTARARSSVHRRPHRRHS